MKILDILNKSMRLLFVAAIMLTASTSRCLAQSGRVDDSTVFAIFVNMFDSLQKEVAKRSQESAPRGKALKDTAMKLFGFDDESDYNNGVIVLAGIKNRINNLDAEAMAYFEKCRTNKQPADPIIAGQFAARHKQILVSGIEDLKKKISPSAWQRLHDFLNTNMKPNIKLLTRTK